MQKQSRQELRIPFIPIRDRKRLHNQIDPALQGYLEWLSSNWAEYFAEERETPTSSSSSHWSSTSWWSPQSWTSNWQGWHQHSWNGDKMVRILVKKNVGGADFKKTRQKFLSTRTKRSDRLPDFLNCFSRPVRRNSLNATGSVHRTPTLTFAQHTFSRCAQCSTVVSLVHSCALRMAQVCQV